MSLTRAKEWRSVWTWKKNIRKTIFFFFYPNEGKRYPRERWSLSVSPMLRFIPVHHSNRKLKQKDPFDFIVTDALRIRVWEENGDKDKAVIKRFLLDLLKRTLLRALSSYRLASRPNFYHCHFILFICFASIYHTHTETFGHSTHLCALSRSLRLFVLTPLLNIASSLSLWYLFLEQTFETKSKQQFNIKSKQIHNALRKVHNFRLLEQ